MDYYNTRVVNMPFEEAISRVTEELKKEGFGVLTEIDVRDTLKKKLDVNFRKYKILGACNPPFAYKALQAEDKIGTMLPCNIIVQETNDGKTEISSINPRVSMQAVKNDLLAGVAAEIARKLQIVLENV
ncbi:MAG TPA: DUF302 domain-containing protein [Ignavibacteriales bacterium]|nr:DUF302 domain-containing protein [Ignavibacteriales bacterium]